MLCLSWPVVCFSQGSRQIASRKIAVVSTTVNDVKKGKPVVYHIRSEYDRKGRLVSEKHFDADSLCTRTQTIRYNRRGDVTEDVTFKGNSQEIIEKTEFYYDKFGRDTLRIESKADGISEKTVFQYNNLDQKTEEKVFDGKGKLMRSSTMTYDKRGMLLTRRTVSDAGEVIYEKNNQYEY